MGAHFFSIDKRLLDTLARSGVFRNFVETGTFKGKTALRASSLFEQVWTVEASTSLYSNLELIFQKSPNIRRANSDSAEWLTSIRKQLSFSGTLYWLDAHWCSDDSTAGRMSQCPLLEELAAIKSLGQADMILIDDARLFTNKPPPPHESSHWPSFSELVTSIQSMSSVHQLRIINDVIFVIPPVLIETVEEYSEKCSENLIDLVWKAKEFDLLRERHRQKLKNPIRRAVARLRRNE